MKGGGTAAQIADEAAAIAAGTMKQSRHEWNNGISSQPQSANTAPAPMECDRFQMDCFVESSSGGNHFGSVLMQGPTPIPWKYWFTIQMMPIVQTSAVVAAAPSLTAGAAPPRTRKSLSPNSTFTNEQMKRPIAITLRAELRSATMPFRKRPTPYTMPPQVRNAPSCTLETPMSPRSGMAMERFLRIT